MTGKWKPTPVITVYKEISQVQNLNFSLTQMYFVMVQILTIQTNVMELSFHEELWLNDSAPHNTTVLETSAILDGAISIGTVIVLFITMISLGCTMQVSKIRDHIMKPKGVAIAVVAQYGVMPLTAFALGKVFQLRPLEAVVVLVCGCCPGGNLSNILALALQGDMNLSIVMTTCSTVLALGLMPLLLYLYCHGIADVGSAVPYTGITLALTMTLVPCGIGILINHFRPQYSKTITKVGISIMLVSMVIIGILAGLTMANSILQVLSPTLTATAALMPLIGYTFGYAISYLFRLDGSGRRTIAMETGCQNIQLCSTILKVAFPPEVIGPYFLFPLIYILFQIVEAGLLILVFRCHQHFSKPNKESEVYQAVSSHLEEVKEPADVNV
ncbi:hepatic sodium/bile acid cotransporter isoform X1 [Osmerus eperlanus]|uniref:hepatic sodium/bile acid cotransporter isoform X1 n=1 Tax=Osmerus eperlanus TaxID=29151 RepID=UPI002E13857B